MHSSQHWMKSSTPSASRSSRQQGAQAHRLNRNEYENTVRDLLAIDTPMHGFDTVAEGLRFSQLQIEKYLEIADTALEAAVDLRVLLEIKNHALPRI